MFGEIKRYKSPIRIRITVVNATRIQHLTQENPTTNTLFQNTPQASNASGTFGHVTSAINLGVNESMNDNGQVRPQLLN